MLLVSLRKVREVTPLGLLLGHRFQNLLFVGFEGEVELGLRDKACVEEVVLEARLHVLHYLKLRLCSRR